jgi:hypothetical protein
VGGGRERERRGRERGEWSGSQTELVLQEPGDVCKTEKAKEREGDKRERERERERESRLGSSRERERERERESAEQRTNWTSDPQKRNTN